MQLLADIIALEKKRNPPAFPQSLLPEVFLPVRQVRMA
jgi:hypothetical protein